MAQEKKARILAPPKGYDFPQRLGKRRSPGRCCLDRGQGGLLGFTKCLARALAANGIPGNAVKPGFMLTEMTRALTRKNIQVLKADIPLGRLCEPEEGAVMVGSLVCKEDHITGYIHRVDEGIGLINLINKEP